MENIATSIIGLVSMDITDTAMGTVGDTDTDIGITVERLVHRIPISRKHTGDAIIVITDHRIALDLKDTMNIITKDAIVISVRQPLVPVHGTEEWHTMAVRCHPGTLVLHRSDRGAVVDIHSEDPAA